MCGYIFGGWMMAKSAHKASCLIKDDDKNKFFTCKKKLDTAAFYSNTVLESSLSLKNVVINAQNVDSILKNNHKN